jgi:tRNA-intron endonuclease
MEDVTFPPLLKIESDTVIIWDDRIGSILYAMGFFGKPLGLRKAKPGKLNRPLVLSLFDVHYLLEHEKILVEIDGKVVIQDEFISYASEIYEDFNRKYMVYRFLREKGYIVRPGMKFGSDFVIYEHGPGLDHSKWVVHVENAATKIRAINIVRAGRLAASVKKKYLISTITKDDQPVFFSFDRVKI